MCGWGGLEVDKALLWAGLLCVGGGDLRLTKRRCGRGCCVWVCFGCGVLEVDEALLWAGLLCVGVFLVWMCVCCVSVCVCVVFQCVCVSVLNNKSWTVLDVYV